MLAVRVHLQTAVVMGLALAGFMLCAPASAVEEVANWSAGQWSTGKSETKARLVAGSLKGRSLAAVEIKLADGWKTYWRTPGDGGGVPPAFNWDKSTNLANATVLYPVPTRFADKAGDTLGYKSLAVFPVEVTARDPSRPVSLVLALDYGICREVCVPVDAELVLDVPVGDTGLVPPAVTAALDRVARHGSAIRATDPRLTKTEVKLDGANPSIAIEAQFPGGTANAAAYLENLDGSYMPLTKPETTTQLSSDKLRFVIDLTGAVDPADIRGKPVKVTLVSEQGLSEAIFKLE